MNLRDFVFSVKESTGFALGSSQHDFNTQLYSAVALHARVQLKSFLSVALRNSKPDEDPQACVQRSVARFVVLLRTGLTTYKRESSLKACLDNVIYYKGFDNWVICISSQDLCPKPPIYLFVSPDGRILD